MKESFKLIPGFDSYAVSNLGNVKNLKSGGLLVHISHHNDGYQVVSLKSNDGKFKTMGVHRLVANAFIENANNSKEVIFIDGDKSNCKSDNLKWRTHKEIMKSTKSVTNKRAPKKVRCEETGEVFDSMYKCSLVYGKSVTGVLYGRTKTYKGLHFFFI